MKEYLGESLYADSDGHSILLTHENGQSSWTICLTPRVYESLVRFASRYIGTEADDDDETHDDDEEDDDDWDYDDEDEYEDDD